MKSFAKVSILVFGIVTSLPSFAADLPISKPAKPASAAQRRALAVVFATDGNPLQASIDYFREVYSALSQSPTWDAVPINEVRQALSATRSGSLLGGIPTIDREAFRKRLPKRLRKRNEVTVVPGTAVPELQRMLDNLRAPAAVVVDCPGKGGGRLLKACALYYYDRISEKVVASVVKKFSAGANDATGWAVPMLKGLENGIATAQQGRDQAIIEELVARGEDDDEKEIKALIGLFGKGDRIRLNNGWNQAVSGGGLQLGALNDNIGAFAEIGYLSWKGNSHDVTEAVRINYGLSMLFRAHAVDSLLWLIEMGGGKEKTRFSGSGNDDVLAVEGVYASISPGVGLELSEFLSLNLSVGWRWYFEGSSSQSGLLKDVSMDDTHGPSLAFRAMILF